VVEELEEKKVGRVGFGHVSAIKEILEWKMFGFAILSLTLFTHNKSKRRIYRAKQKEKKSL
jgi:hypothetical protein